MTKVIGRPFPKGVSGNPGGKPATPKDIKEARSMGRIEFERLLNKFIHMDRATLSEYVKRPDATAMELLIASIVSKAITGGDHLRANFVLDRLIGKVADNLNSDSTIKIILEDYMRKDPK
jgi:hypothetical protein